MKVGIMGAGTIAIKMANTIKEMEDVTCYAIASRSLKKAEAFKEEYGFEVAYGSYEELAKDDNVDLVYIATPHSEHHDNAIMAMNYGRNVLCEKAFAVNAKEAREMIEVAKEKKVYLAEAIWTRYMPYREIVEGLIKEDKIGEIISVSGNLGYSLMNIERNIRPELAGGALLDIGVYPINFASIFLGDEIESVVSTCVKMETGVDETNAIILKYKSGQLAVLSSTFRGGSDQQGIIYGTKGYIIVRELNNPVGVEIYNNQGELVEKVSLPKKISGYEYEVMEAARAIKEGRRECAQAPHDITIKIMELMDSIRKEWGIKYPFE